MEVITRQTVVDKLAAYLQHELSLPNLVTWAETALMEGEFERNHFGEIRDVVARLGVADVRAFGLTWEDCEQLLKRLGYSAHVHIEARPKKFHSEILHIIRQPPSVIHLRILSDGSPPNTCGDDRAGVVSRHPSSTIHLPFIRHPRR